MSTKPPERATNDQDRKAAEEYCQNATGNIAIRFYGSENFTENPLIMAFLMGIQHARSQERSRLIKFLTWIGYRWAINTQLDRDKMVDYYLEEESKT